jgi:phage baseplate assembly protein W
MTSLTGMARDSGVTLSGDGHLAQSIEDIVTTPIGARVMRRDYGCLLFDLLDRPFNSATRLLCSMAIAMAIARWEPRLTVRQVRLLGDLAIGQAQVVIDGVRTDAPANVLTRLTIPLSRAAARA